MSRAEELETLDALEAMEELRRRMEGEDEGRFLDLKDEERAERARERHFRNHPEEYR